MNQPSVYSYERILDAAVEVIRVKGPKRLTARDIAKQMGASTMPIYSNVTSMDELESDVRKKIQHMLDEYQKKKYTDQVLLNAAFGYVVFARDEKNLFRYLVLDQTKPIELEDKALVQQKFERQFGSSSPEVKELLAMPSGVRQDLTRYTWIFTHGLAMMVNAGMISDLSDDAIKRYLQDAGSAFFLWGMGMNKEEQTDDRNIE